MKKTIKFLYHNFLTCTSKILMNISLRFAMDLKNELLKFGLLDYNKSQIKLIIESPTHIGRLKSCKKEPDTVVWIEENFNHSAVLYDIGANVGAYSLIAGIIAKNKKNSFVYSFEPVPQTFSALLKNVNQNDLFEYIKCFPVALGKKNEILPINLSSEISGDAMHAVGEPIDAYGNLFVPKYRYNIMCFSLDEFITLYKLELPTMIKIDVDGTELDILNGSLKTLASDSLQYILVEVRKDSKISDNVVSLLNKFNFKLINSGKVYSSEFINYHFKK